MGKFIDRTGLRYGRLTVLSLDESPPSKSLKWFCRCDCGVEKSVLATGLATGDSKSCGCLALEQSRARNRTHGMSRSRGGVGAAREYNIWVNIRARCNNPQDPSYPRYGGRGITVCDRWQASFEDFLADMGAAPSKHHSIDRKNNSEGYNPGNCRWATPTEQGRNKRNNRMLELDGVSRPLIEWVEITGISRSAINVRLRKGLPISEVLRR